MLNRIRHFLIGAVASFCCAVPALAQTVSPTVGGGSTHTNISSTDSFVVTGGESQLNTLFHSFESFSPNDIPVLFQLDGNQSAIDYVISRVTGGDLSFIDSSVSLTGGNSPDLFLINPNGISFGAGASLNVPGNFTASTAESVLFENNLSFGNTSGSHGAIASPLLTVSAPVGLQYGNVAGVLEVQSSALSVNPGNTLSLFGGSAHIIDGAQLTAAGGRLQIAGSAANTILDLNADGSLNIDNSSIAGTTDFEDLLIQGGVQFNVSGATDGHLTLLANNITLTNGSNVNASATQGTLAGDVDIHAAGTFTLTNGSNIYANVLDSGDTGRINITANTADVSNGSQIFNQAQGSGHAGGINVTANDVAMQFGGQFHSQSTGAGNGGDVTINAANQLLMDSGAGIFSDAQSSGRGGNIFYNAGNLSITGGAGLSNGTSSSGKGGNITLTATDTLTLNSGFGNGTSSDGNAGNITLSAKTITLESGAGFGNGTTSSGNAGDISFFAENITLSPGSGFGNNTSSTGQAGNINLAATDTLTILSGFGNGTTDQGNAGNINLSGATIDILQTGFNNSSSGSGHAGDINLTGGRINIAESGFNNESYARGDAGQISFDVETLNILQSGVSATSYSGGNSGGIDINATGDVTVTEASLAAETSGSGNAGDITLKADTVELLRANLTDRTSSSGNAGSITLTANQLTVAETTLANGTESTGNAGDIHITAGQLVMRDALFGPDTSSSGNAGNVNIVAHDYLLEGGGFGATTNGSGNGGFIKIDANSFTLIDSGFGANIGTESTGQGGSIDVTVTETLSLQNSGIGTDAFGNGRAANLTVRAGEIAMNRSGIGASTLQGSNAGVVTLVADSIALKDSNITSSARENSTGNAGTVDITTGSLVLIDSIIGTEVKNTDSTGSGGRITVRADTIVLQEGENETRRTEIDSQHLGDGDSGIIDIAAQELLVDGGVIAIAKFGDGDGGILNLNTNKLTLTDQAFIFAANGTGATGAGNSVAISAQTAVLDDSSTVTVATGGEGSGGRLSIVADTLNVLGGSQIESSSLEEIGFTAEETYNFETQQTGSLNLVTPTLPAGTLYGDAGNVSIEANTVNVSGSDSSGSTSRITALSRTNGAAGSVDINTRNLNIRDQAQVSVSGFSTGRAGNLTVESDAIRLSNGASLQADVTQGNQGNVVLNASETVMLSRDSLIKTNATGTASGGNISIDTPFLIGLEDSDIAANAIQGAGGNISISAQSVLGLSFRDRLTPGNDITASSESGLQGSVSINNITVDPSAALVELPKAPADAASQIANACAATTGNQFIASGRGGLPVSPTHQVTGNRIWRDVRTPLASLDSDSSGVSLPQKNKPDIIEASAWQANSQGQIELLPEATLAVVPSATCTTHATAHP